MTFPARVSKTGGRSAATRHIPPKLALSVGMPKTPAPKGWQWSALTELARLESGHTPSRKHPEYWRGDIPWISIGDARAHDGKRIDDTEEKTNELGIENSSARILPANTVCLSRTASVGYVVVMGQPMATSQDFVNWVCSKKLDCNFLKYLFIAEDEDLLRFASGAVHQTIYFPEVKAFHIRHPSLAEQKRIVGLLDEAFAGLATAKANAEKNLQNSRALVESHLESVFTMLGKGRTITTISGVAEVFDGPHATPKTVDRGPVFLGISALQDGKINLGETRHVSLEDFQKWTRRVRPRANDVVFSYETRLGQAAIIPEGLDCCLGRRMGLVRLDQTRIDPRFFVHQYLSPPFRAFLGGRTVRGATVDRIALKEFPTFPIALPPLIEQVRVADKIEDLRAKTQRLEGLYRQKLVALEGLKRSLLHQAFSGNL
ncbi:MAG: restriction endonuclease subunit S [Thermoanaerobaculia bacterium]